MKMKISGRAIFPWVSGLLLLAGMSPGIPLRAQDANNPDAPTVSKVEPPNWWVGLTPDVLLLVSGKNLQATHASCNLREVTVSRTQSTGDGDYLFVWLKFEPGLRSGTAICRITTAHGQTTFELPLAARAQILGRNQGLTLDDVIYQIVPDRFADGDPLNDQPAGSPGSHDRGTQSAYHGGDLRGIEQHLDYLKILGVTTLLLAPIVKSGAAQNSHVVGATDLYAVDPHLGTLADFQALVEAAHKQHMKVFFDTAPNHVGPTNPWVNHPPMPDWFHGSPEHHLTAASSLKPSFYGLPEKLPAGDDALESLVDPHITPPIRKNLTEGWIAGMLPDLNTENQMVVQYLVENSVWWAEISGLDGYAVDAVPYVSRRFWEQWHMGLRKLYPRLSTIGEVAHADPAVTSFYQGGRSGWDGVDTQVTSVFDYPLNFALRDVLQRAAPVGEVTNILRKDSLYPHPSFLVTFFDNPDAARFAGKLQGTPAQLKLAYGFILTARGVPELFYGDELGMSSGGNSDNRPDFPGGWPSDPKDAFKKEGRTAQQEEIFEYVQGLLRLRSQHPALRGGKLWSLASDDTTYVFLRESDEERVLVAFHAGGRTRELSLSLAGTAAQDAANALAISGEGQAELAGRTVKLRLPAVSVSLFSLQ